MRRADGGSRHSSEINKKKKVNWCKKFSLYVMLYNSIYFPTASTLTQCHHLI